MSYTDELTASSTRHSARITLRTAVDANGRITAHEARIAYDGGAYAAGNPGPRLVPVETMGSLPGYRVPAARVEAIDVYTNTLPAGNARCPGGPQVLFAAESHMDLIARDLGLDPIDFRLRNLAEVGDLDVHGERWIGSEMRTILTKLREVVRWDAPRGPNRGRGVAMALRHVGFGRTSLTLTLLPDGSIDVRTGVTDQGSGGFTVIQRVIAQELGLEPDCVRVQQATTASAPEDPGVGGSRVTAVHGNAALDGARKLRAILDQRAPGQTIAEAAMRLGPLEVVGVGEQDQHVYGGCAYGLEVAVNPDTGECRVTSAALVADVGTVINPVALRGQLEGGFVYGLGQALTEELRVEDGRVVNPLLADYKLPTIADAPSLDIVLHTEAPGCGPFGAKSVGELTNAPVPAAVANAIHDAAGVRLFSLPLSAEKVLAALEERASVDASALSEARRTAA
jgi:CO/xanthine dehydrogenase Mo-binding subunit